MLGEYYKYSNENDDVTGITRVDLPPVGHMFLSYRLRCPHARTVRQPAAAAAAAVAKSRTARALSWLGCASWRMRGGGTAAAAVHIDNSLLSTTD